MKRFKLVNELGTCFGNSDGLVEVFLQNFDVLKHKVSELVELLPVTLDILKLSGVFDKFQNL